jgi:hypothetical protein
MTIRLETPAEVEAIKAIIERYLGQLPPQLPWEDNLEARLATNINNYIKKHSQG